VKSLWKALLCWLFMHVSVAHAAPSLDVAQELRGATLGHIAEVHIDSSAAETVDDVAALTTPGSFRAIAQDTPSFGFSAATHWFRITVHNRASVEHDWFLDVGFPLLDSVVLYTPHADGHFTGREMGDNVPFARRDLATRTFVFTLNEPARSSRTYFLAVRSEGALTVPMHAWSPRAFLEHQHLDWAGLNVFYGVVLVTSSYSAMVFALSHALEFLWFALVVLSAGLFQFCFVGHAAQFLPWHSIYIAQHGPIVCAAAWLFLNVIFSRAHGAAMGAKLPLNRGYRVMLGLTLGALVCAAVAPVRISFPIVVLVLIVVNVRAAMTQWHLLRSGLPLVAWTLMAWLCLLTSAAVTALTSAGIVPTTTLSQWSLQIGATLQFVLTATANAGRVHLLRSELADLNRRLASHVGALGQAVVRAEHAHAVAEDATRVRDEFVATMTHELRTPLNVIINVPPGLIEDFPLEERVLCAHCQAQFLLDPGELLDKSARCGECGTAGALQLTYRARYAGEPSRTLRYLEKVERSGRHLLQVIEGMLARGRTRAAPVALCYELVAPSELARDVVDELSALGERAGVTLQVQSSTGSEKIALDPLRIRQVLINLVGNAIKFSEARGRVAVAVEMDGADCLFSVRDEGVGIAPEELQRVFERYEQAQEGERQGGTGLGLPIARALVQAHGGDIAVQSTPGSGTAFCFRIPRRKNAA
jgi:signal transduction histidine kinase